MTPEASPTRSASAAETAGDGQPLVAAADGSALGNPGPAGWAWYVDEDTWEAGGWPHGTNNMGELKAVLALLEATADRPERPLRILCDSQYAINCITRWMPGWKRNGWRKKDRKPVLNRDLLEALDAAMQGRRCEFEWVKGHAGHALNEAADARARAAATAYQRGREPERGPGFPSGDRARAGAPASQAAASARDASATPGSGLTRSQETRADASAGTAVVDGSVDTAVAGRTVADGSASDADGTAPAADLDVVRRLEAALGRPQLHEDPRALGRHLHPDLTWVTRRGRVADRETALRYPQQAFAQDTDPEPLRALRPDPDSVLLISRAAGRRGPLLRSSLWTRAGAEQEGPGWRLLLRQDTPED